MQEGMKFIILILKVIYVKFQKKYLKKAKRRKATGPDEIPIEFFKEMDDDNLQELLNALNKWWREEEEIPDDFLKARIFLLYKKGQTKDIENYRPISSLQTFCRVLASLIKESQTLEKTNEYRRWKRRMGTQSTSRF